MNLENKKQVAIILLALGLGLVAAVLTGNYIQGSIKMETARLSKDFENKRVKPLEHAMAKMQQDMKKLANRPVQVIQQSSDPKKASKPAVPKSSLALRTPAGRRAYTIRIDSLSAVGGMVNPGDYVDVLAHMTMPDPEGTTGGKVSSIVFQNLQILAVGTNLQAPGGYEKQQSARSLNLTFALTPEEAGLMSLVERNGRMQLILRAPAETEVEIIQPSTWTALADYVFEKQGTELVIPRARAVIQPLPSQKREEVKPFIQIFQKGKKM